MRLRPTRLQEVAARMARILSSPPLSAELEDLARQYCERLREDQWLRFCALHSTKLAVETTVVGLEKLGAALDQGREVRPS